MYSLTTRYPAASSGLADVLERAAREAEAVPGAYASAPWRFLAASPAAAALLEGIPAGLELDVTRHVDPELARRQGGYGRGRRMQIEHDRAELLSGVRLGQTLGSPISMLIWNRDWENWTVAMAHEAPGEGVNPKLTRNAHIPSGMRAP